MVLIEKNLTSIIKDIYQNEIDLNMNLSNEESEEKL